jgi:hypothetical protein
MNTKAIAATKIKVGDRLFVGGAETLPIVRIDPAPEYYNGACIIVHFDIDKGRHFLLDADTWYHVVVPDEFGQALEDEGIDREALTRALTRSGYSVVRD